MNEKKISPLFKIIKGVLRICYPKIEAVGIENLPEESSIIVGNHSQLHGPVCCELFFPIKRCTWCAGEMMNLKDVPSYAYKDFWSEKPKFSRPFYKLLSYLIAPLSVLIFNNANTIGVYHDTRIMSTFRNTIEKLNQGESVVIFPEHNVKYNNILYQFQDRYIDIAKIYYKKTGRELNFVPLYIAPKLKKMYLGKPIKYASENNIEIERKRITEYLMSEITDMAINLPEHTVVPYRNIPKRHYPLNTKSISLKEKQNEKTCC